jgi:hypothetical protein
MQPLLMLAIGVALAASACGTPTSDGAGPLPGSGSDAAPGASEQAAAARPAAPVPPVDRGLRIPGGTVLALTLVSPVGSDTSAVGDAVVAELTQAITINGREALPAGAELAGVVTRVDRAGRVTGRATVTFRFTSLRVGDQQYELEAAPVSQMAPATTWEDATKLGVGTGAVSGGLLDAADGADGGVTDEAAGGEEVRLDSGADVATELTVPLMVREPN